MCLSKRKFVTVLYGFTYKKENSSGRISVQIIDRTHRQYKVIETIGSSKNITDVEL